MAMQDAEKRERPPKKPTGKGIRYGGKKSSYNPEIAQIICEQLSEGIPLREICRQEGMPAWRTVYDWMYQDQELSAAIAHARDMGYDQLAEECLAIADDASNDWMERIGEDGQTIGWQLNKEHVNRSRLRVETRLKLLAKFNPKRYGDRVSLAGDPDAPIKMEVENEANRLFSELLKNIELKNIESSRSK